MSTAAVAAEAQTTDWRTYDGGVLPDFLGIAVVFPVAMAIFLVLPAALCYCCLSRRRLVPYQPPNMVGGSGGLGMCSRRWLEEGCFFFFFLSLLTGWMV